MDANVVRILKIRSIGFEGKSLFNNNNREIIFI